MQILKTVQYFVKNHSINTIWVVILGGTNFRGFRGCSLSTKIKHDNITVYVIKISADPRKYKPTNSLCFGYQQIK